MDNQNTKNWQDTLFEWFGRNKPLVFIAINGLYLVLLGVILVVTYSIYNDREIFNLFSINRAWFGRVALLFLLLVITPGILGRLNIQIKITRIITLFRRQLGILVFLIAFTHYHLVSLPKLVGIEPNVLPLFQVMGLSALIILSLMFFTSNNFSARRLGKWWKRLHRLVYVVLLLVLLHTSLQRVSVWSILAATFFTLEVISLSYAYFKGGSFNNPTLSQSKKS